MERDCFRTLTVCLRTFKAVAREAAWSQGLVYVFDYARAVG